MAEKKRPTALDVSPTGAVVGRNAKTDPASLPKTESNDVGTALRNAFRATVEEDIPSEMLDLLRRLD